MKIYTKTGDDGTTGLFAGPRIPKDAPRIEAYGTVDELNAVLGVVLAWLPAQSDATRELLSSIQGDLFSIGAELATPDPAAHQMCLLRPERVEYLEQWIDRLQEGLPSLQSFILPGGSAPAAMLHLARTVSRRAERDVVALSHQADVHDCSLLIRYLNRLSDLLFVLARDANHKLGVADSPWHRPS